jgi:uncharacterized protein
MQEISSEEIIQRIRIENPWWEGDHKISLSYRTLKKRAYFDLFFPMVMNRSVRRAVVLMGPRRVGKTVMIHQAIQSLIDQGAPPKSLCYFSVDHPIYNGLSLEKLLEYYAQATGINHKSQNVYAFFDEIQYLREWEIHLKSAVDTYPNMKALASGSSAAALRLKSQESGAGRFTDFLLPPLTFYEYLDLLGKNDLVEKPVNLNAREKTFFVTKNIEEVNQQFIEYLNFGGYPEAISSTQIQSDPARFIKSDIIDKVLLRDLPSLYGISDIQELNYLFTALAFNTAKEVSLEELSKNSGVAKNTIKRYIEYLEAAFLIKVVHRVDRNARRFRRANFFKVYLANPSMRAALFSPMKSSDEAMGALAETAIFSQWFHSQFNSLYYARWPEGEVDIVSLSSATQKADWAVEVKWSDRYCERPEELKNVSSFCRSNGLSDAVVTSKTTALVCRIDEVAIEFIPTSLYCYSVGFNVINSKRLHETASAFSPESER